MYESFVTEEGLEKPLSIQYILVYETTMLKLQHGITVFASPSQVGWYSVIRVSIKAPTEGDSF